MEGDMLLLLDGEVEEVEGEEEPVGVWWKRLEKKLKKRCVNEWVEEERGGVEVVSICEMMVTCGCVRWIIKSESSKFVCFVTCALIVPL